MPTFCTNKPLYEYVRSHLLLHYLLVDELFCTLHSNNLYYTSYSTFRKKSLKTEREIQIGTRKSAKNSEEITHMRKTERIKSSTQMSYTFLKICLLKRFSCVCVCVDSYLKICFRYDTFYTPTHIECVQKPLVYRNVFFPFIYAYM